MSYHNEVIADNPSAYWSFQDAAPGKVGRTNLCPDPAFSSNAAISKYWTATSGNVTLSKNTGVQNLLTANQANLESGNTTGWTGDGVTPSVNQTPYTGSYGMTGTVSSAGTWAGIYSNPRPAVVGGRTYSISGMLKTSSTRIMMLVGIFKTAGGVQTGSAIQATNAVSPSNWTNYSGTGVAPADATMLEISIRILDCQINDVFLVDCLGAWEGTGGAWIPGSTSIGSPFAFVGNTSMQILSNAGSNSVVLSGNASTLAEQPAVPGKPYFIKLRGITSVVAGNSTFKVGFIWTTAAGTTLTNLSVNQALSSTAWSAPYFRATAPPDAATVRPVVTVTMANGETIYLDAILLEQTAKEGEYFDGDSVDCAWVTDASGISVFGVSRTNLLNNPQLSGTASPNWSLARMTAEIKTSGGRTGAYWKATITDYTAPYIALSASTTYMSRCRPGNKISVSFYARPYKTGQYFSTSIYWYNINGELISLSGGSSSSMVNGKWSRSGVSAVAPANAYYFRSILAVAATNTVNGDVVDFCDVLAEHSASVNEYFDGTFANCAWTGTAHLSTSTTSVGDDETIYNNDAKMLAGYTKYPQALEEYNSVQLTQGSVIKYTDTYPTNLLTDNNASFETSVSASGSNCTVAQDATYAAHGTKSMLLTSSAAGTISSTIVTQSVTPGETYTIVGKFKTDKPGGMGVFLSVASLSDDSYRVQAVKDSWVEYRKTFTVPPGVTTTNIAISSSALFGGHPTAAGQKLWFDCFGIFKGVVGSWSLPSATTYSPQEKSLFPVKTWTGYSDKKPFIFECLVRPETYRSKIALLETYCDEVHYSMLGYTSAPSSRDYISAFSGDAFFPGQVLSGGASGDVNRFAAGTYVTSVYKQSVAVTNATYAGGTITYTAPGHDFVANSVVQISGITPTAYNVQGTVASVNGDDFTITQTIAGGTFSVAGTASNAIINISAATTGSVASGVRLNQVQNSGVYYEDGSVYVRLYGTDKQGRVVDEKVSALIDSVDSTHVVVKFDGEYIEIYGNGKILNREKITIPDIFATINGYRTRAITGNAFVSNVALYNSSVNISEILAHNDSRATDKADVGIYSEGDVQFFDINRSNNTDVDSIESPAVNSWRGWTANNVFIASDNKTLGLRKMSSVEPSDSSLVTFGTNGASLKSASLLVPDASLIMSKDFAVTATFRFDQYTQDSDAYDGQKFCVYQVVTKDKSAQFNVYRILKDVGGTIKTYLALGYQEGNGDERLELIDYTSYGTSFPTTPFNIMLKRSGNQIILMVYNVAQGTNATVSITDPAISGYSDILLYVGGNIDGKLPGFVTVTNLKLVSTLSAANELTFMNSDSVKEEAKAPLSTTNNYGIFQQGYATVDVSSSQTNSNGLPNLSVGDARITWSPEMSNISVKSSVVKNIVHPYAANGEMDNSGWSLYGAASAFATDTTYSVIGRKCYKLTSNGAGIGYAYGNAWSQIVGGQTYTASAMLRSSKSSGELGFVGFELWNGTTWASDDGGYTSFSISSNGWIQATHTLTTPADAKMARVIVGRTSGATDAITYIDCVGLWPGTSTQWALPTTSVGENILREDQSTFEGNSVAGYNSNQNCTATVTTANVYSGTYAMQLSSSAAGSMSVWSSGAYKHLVEPFAEYTVTAMVKSAAVSRTFNAQIYFYDDAGTSLGVVSSSTTTSTTEWTESRFNVVAPAGAVTSTILVQIQSTAGASEIHYIDNVGVIKGANQKFSAPSNRTSEYETIPYSGYAPSWFYNGGNVPSTNTIKIDFATNDSEDDVPLLNKFNVQYDSVGVIQEIKTGEQIKTSGGYTFTQDNKALTYASNNNGIRLSEAGALYYGPDVLKDNLISNWSFNGYEGWTCNGSERIVVDPGLSSGVALQIPVVSTATLSTDPSIKYPVAPSTSYTLCFYVKASGAYSATAVASIDWLNVAGTSAGSSATSASIAIDETVTKIYVTGTSPASAVSARVNLAITSTEDQLVTVDTVVLNEGSSTIDLTTMPWPIFSLPHSFKTVGMIVRPGDTYTSGNAYTLFDAYLGSTRYSIYFSTTYGIMFSGFTSLYINGTAASYGTGTYTELPTDGWSHIVATIDTDEMLMPSSTRKAYFGSTTGELERGPWVFDSVWFQRSTATETSAMNHYQSIFGRVNTKIYDTLTSSPILTMPTQAATYSLVSNVATFTTTYEHNLKEGQSVYIDFTSGTATDGTYTINKVLSGTSFTATVVNANTSGAALLYNKEIGAYEKPWSNILAPDTTKS